MMDVIVYDEEATELFIVGSPSLACPGR